MNIDTRQYNSDVEKININLRSETIHSGADIESER